ncbi:hypothetical protein [Micromonospora sp. SH-82]|uniref:hypothetical protein n=1 Tax=Micromonospora sp. SH-82 TaxID=3132938 RepID=UPI003EBD1563
MGSSCLGEDDVAEAEGEAGGDQEGFSAGEGGRAAFLAGPGIDDGQAEAVAAGAATGVRIGNVAQQVPVVCDLAESGVRGRHDVSEPVGQHVGGEGHPDVAFGALALDELGEAVGDLVLSADGSPAGQIVGQVGSQLVESTVLVGGESVLGLQFGGPTAAGLVCLLAVVDVGGWLVRGGEQDKVLHTSCDLVVFGVEGGELLRRLAKPFPLHAARSLPVSSSRITGMSCGGSWAVVPGPSGGLFVDEQPLEELL